MKRVIGLALVLALRSTLALAKDDDDDDKVPAAEVTKIEETLSTLGCSGYESVKKRRAGHLRDRRCQVQDGHGRYQARQGLYCDSHFALLSGAFREGAGKPARFSFHRSCAG